MPVDVREDLNITMMPGTGTWRILEPSIGDIPVVALDLTTEPSENFGTGLLVFWEGSELVLFTLVGDPDEGNAYVFRRTNDG